MGRRENYVCCLIWGAVFALFFVVRQNATPSCTKILVPFAAAQGQARRLESSIASSKS